MVGSTVLSALVHPWFYVLAGFELTNGGMLARPDGLLGWPFWLIAWFDLLTGYLASMGLGLLAVRGRGYRDLLKANPADAVLLAADLRRRLPGAVAVHDRALRVGEDRARAGAEYRDASALTLV